jgi:Xaa-Pro aminopeptidase
MAFLGKKVFEYRRSMMRGLMARHDLDALAFTDADFFQFATNFHTDVRPWERPIMVVVPADGEPFAVMNELSTNHMRMARERGTVWVADVTFYAEHPRLAGRLPLLPQWPELVADVLSGHGLEKGRIGIDGGGPLIKRVADLLGHLEFVPLVAGMRELRWVKHADEIALMRQAAALSDWAQDRFRENIRPGRLVQELDRAMDALMVEEGARRFPGENLEVGCWTLSGPASASPHGDGAPTGKRIEKGHGLVNIVNPRLNGLKIENERTWFCGKPSAKQGTLYEVAREASAAGTAQAVTGNPVSAIDAAAQAVIEKAGFGENILHRTGHGMGTTGHEFPEDMAFNHRPLRAGEVYSSEPGIYVYGLGGFRIDDTVVVGEKPEVLTKAPRDIESQTVS